MGIRTARVEGLRDERLKGLRILKPAKSLSQRCEKLYAALEIRRGLRPNDPHAFGQFGERLALVALEAMDDERFKRGGGGQYLIAWETAGRVRRDYSHERDNEYRHVAIPRIPPALRSEFEHFAREVFTPHLLERVHAQIVEAGRRERDFFQDLETLRDEESGGNLSSSPA